MRHTPVAVDAGHAALSEGLVRTGCRRRLLRERHRGRRMTAAALGGVVRLQFRPDFLRQLQAMSFILRRRIELPGHVSPNLGVRLDVPHEPRQECRRHVTVAAAGLNTERIRVMRAMRIFLERCVHFVAGGAEFVGFGIFQTGDEATRETYSDQEGEQSTGGYAEQEPALRPPPEPLPEPPMRRLRGVQHVPRIQPCAIK